MERWQKMGFKSKEAYEAEIKRKNAARIPLTNAKEAGKFVLENRDKFKRPNEPKADAPIWKRMGFSSPEAYEAEIKRKAKEGTKLTNPKEGQEYLVKNKKKFQQGGRASKPAPEAKPEGGTAKELPGNGVTYFDPFTKGTTPSKPATPRKPTQPNKPALPSMIKQSETPINWPSKEQVGKFAKGALFPMVGLQEAKAKAERVKSAKRQVENAKKKPGTKRRATE